MEKLLAMSILSSTPANVSGSWMDAATAAMRKNKKANDREEKSESSSSNCSGGERMPAPAEKSPRQQQRRGASRAWFAPEFDGLNCFETLVSH